eukprot:87231-Hanusia_phi.AAC.1
MSEVRLPFISSSASIRVTKDVPMKFSVIDMICHATQKNNNDSAQEFRRLKANNPEIRTICSDFKFPGQGQRETPVADAEGMLEIIMLLPGQLAAKHRRRIAKVFIRFLAGDQSLHAELDRNAASTDPISQVARENISSSRAGTAQVSDDKAVARPCKRICIAQGLYPGEWTAEDVRTYINDFNKVQLAKIDRDKHAKDTELKMHNKDKDAEVEKHRISDNNKVKMEELAIERERIALRAKEIEIQQQGKKETDNRTQEKDTVTTPKAETAASFTESSRGPHEADYTIKGKIDYKLQKDPSHRYSNIPPAEYVNLDEKAIEKYRTLYKQEPSVTTQDGIRMHVFNDNEVEATDYDFLGDCKPEWFPLVNCRVSWSGDDYVGLPVGTQSCDYNGGSGGGVQNLCTCLVGHGWDASQGRCVSCSVWCSGGYYSTGTCRGGVGYLCTACSAACSGDSYETVGCGGWFNRVCSSCATCQSGQYQTRDCREGGNANNRQCSNCDVCDNTQYMVTDCLENGVVTQNRVCPNCATHACPAGEHLVGCGYGSLGDCMLCATCLPGTYETTACQEGGNATVDRVCSPCATCLPWEYEATACQEGGDVTQPRECSNCTTRACPAGEYLVGCGYGSLGDCTPCGSCNSTSYQASACAFDAPGMLRVCGQRVLPGAVPAGLWEWVKGGVQVM